MNEKGLAYIGIITEICSIRNSKYLSSVTVVCGAGGKWKGVVRSEDFKEGNICLVFLPDCMLPEIPCTAFMGKQGYRVRMMKLIQVPSEVLIMKVDEYEYYEYLIKYKSLRIGDDVTEICGCVKYEKKIPVKMAGKMRDWFPNFIPKTDEPNYQRYDIEGSNITNHPYYITEKMDGTSCTVFRLNGCLHVCSRNIDLLEDDENVYWKVANKYGLKEKLPEGIAVQFEICGPNIQENRQGIKELSGFVFSMYDIKNKAYLEFDDMADMCMLLGMERCKLLETGAVFEVEWINRLGWFFFTGENKNREGIVVRSMKNIMGNKPASFKIINLNYEN